MLNISLEFVTTAIEFENFDTFTIYQLSPRIVATSTAPMHGTDIALPLMRTDAVVQALSSWSIGAIAASL